MKWRKRKDCFKTGGEDEEDSVMRSVEGQEFQAEKSIYKSF